MDSEIREITPQLEPEIKFLREENKKWVEFGPTEEDRIEHWRRQNATEFSTVPNRLRPPEDNDLWPRSLFGVSGCLLVYGGYQLIIRLTAFEVRKAHSPDGNRTSLHLLAACPET